MTIGRISGNWQLMVGMHSVGQRACSYVASLQFHDRLRLSQVELLTKWLISMPKATTGYGVRVESRWD